MPQDPRQPGGQQPRQAQQQQYAPQREQKARNEFELFDKLIRGGADLKDGDGQDELNEFDDSLPTANHSKTETDLTRSKASLMSNYRHFLKSLGMTPGKSEFIKETSKNLMFINQSSKAKKGFGDLLVRTDHVYQTVDEYSKAELGDEDKGVVESLKESVGGAMGGKQVIGDPAEDGYLSDRKGNGTWR